MTLIMGARCIDGVVLVADRKINCREGSESVYGDKITGEITEVLTGFSGDRGTFELFRNRLRCYAKEIDEQIKKGPNKEIDIDEIIWQIHEIKMGFRRIYDDGGFIPIDKYKVIGELLRLHSSCSNDTLKGRRRI